MENKTPVDKYYKDFGLVNKLPKNDIIVIGDFSQIMFELFYFYAVKSFSIEFHFIWQQNMEHGNFHIIVIEAIQNSFISQINSFFIFAFFKHNLAKTNISVWPRRISYQHLDLLENLAND